MKFQNILTALALAAVTGAAFSSAALADRGPMGDMPGMEMGMGGPGPRFRHALDLGCGTGYFTRDYDRGSPEGKHPWHGQPVLSEAEFVAIMDGLNLPKPRRIDEAVPANLTSGRREHRRLILQAQHHLAGEVRRQDLLIPQHIPDETIIVLDKTKIIPVERKIIPNETTIIPNKSPMSP